MATSSGRILELSDDASVSIGLLPAFVVCVRTAATFFLLILREYLYYYAFNFQVVAMVTSCNKRQESRPTTKNKQTNNKHINKKHTTSSAQKLTGITHFNKADMLLHSPFLSLFSRLLAAF
jgi:hypothetical protein